MREIKQAIGCAAALAAAVVGNRIPLNEAPVDVLAVIKSMPGFEEE